MGIFQAQPSPSPSLFCSSLSGCSSRPSLPGLSLSLSAPCLLQVSSASVHLQLQAAPSSSPFCRRSAIPLQLKSKGKRFRCDK
ncbi:hypothetical protein CRG98_040347 [Punica granatum]|uniref:Uncharacterized protein n=1 Tax=Punica granatum TaxID=22663 RepID=A0A2I0I5P6_PUNGR|nr:hypothetical protein CRG98_040347 [Punica granatum]